MLEDKLKSTDWDATLSSIEEAVARESYLVWLKEQEEQYQLKERGEVITMWGEVIYALLSFCVVFIYQ